MPLPITQLDDRRFDDLVAEARQRLVSQLPELAQVVEGDGNSVRLGTDVVGLADIDDAMEPVLDGISRRVGAGCTPQEIASMAPIAASRLPTSSATRASSSTSPGA